MEERRTIIVDDVNKFQGHIACSPDSKSEIVIPIFKNNNTSSSPGVFAVLDIDSDKFAYFDDNDKKYLEILAELISNKL